MTFASLTNLIVAALCTGVIFQSARMIRHVRQMQAGDLGDTIKSLDRATAQARAVLAELKDVLLTDGAANARTVATAETLRDELSVMVGIGNAVADRIMDAASKPAEPAEPEAAPKPKRPRRRRSTPRTEAAATEAAPVHASLQ